MWTQNSVRTKKKIGKLKPIPTGGNGIYGTDFMSLLWAGAGWYAGPAGMDGTGLETVPPIGEESQGL